MKKKLGTDPVPVAGKTFCLFGADGGTDAYYQAIRELADHGLEIEPHIERLIDEVRSLGKRPRLAKKLSAAEGTTLHHFLVRESSRMLSAHTTAVAGHLRELAFFRRFDGVIGFTEEQYHLTMLEVELMNRAFGDRFRVAGRKLAFLPHCLRDLDASCRAAPADIDYACRGCSLQCNVNAVSALLRENGVEPYIWMQARLKALFRKLKQEEGGLGVLGIACVPELVRGMRMCHKLGVPVVGAPLNANRCARWMGTFNPTSVEMKEVERLVKGEG